MWTDERLGAMNHCKFIHSSAFTAPVDNPDVRNIAKAGRTIPLKWRIVDAGGNPVTDLAETNMTLVALACEQGENPDPIEEHAQGTSGLQNLGDGYYQWNWKTPKHRQSHRPGSTPVWRELCPPRWRHGPGARGPR
jgi:hypothetical protein